MKRIKFYLLLILARFLSLIIKIHGKSSGTSLIGMITLKIEPNFLKEASKYTKQCVTVTGTNGKTTTSGILSHILKFDKYSVLNNAKGANMLSGIANTYVLGVSPLKKYDYAVLESDEAYLSKLYDSIQSNYLVVTNLFRDQLDRYGELSTTAKKIQNAIDKNRDIQLILNADDPLVVNFRSLGDKKPIFYGFNKVEYHNKNIESNAPMEILNCPWCGGELQYESRFYAQQGHYYCSCGYRRPQCKYSADVIIYNDYSIIKMNYNNIEYSFKIQLLGLYNAYNALAAIATAFELGVTDIQKAIDTYQSAFGRSEIREINERKAIIQLIKNPTGASEVLKTVDFNSNILIIINDNYADGRDVSWLWDTNFEILQGVNKTIITSGTRAYDMAVRLKYAGINNVKVIQNIDEAVRFVSGKGADRSNITILPTYTALLHINKKGD